MGELHISQVINALSISGHNLLSQLGLIPLPLAQAHLGARTRFRRQHLETNSSCAFFTHWPMRFAVYFGPRNPDSEQQHGTQFPACRSISCLQEMPIMDARLDNAM